MGEVYRARDTRLGREVAIKVLPEALAKDADRLRRFEQEARTIAALNHPNILGIHDIGTFVGAPFLVSEFLDGQTLREKLETGPARPIGMGYLTHKLDAQTKFDPNRICVLDLTVSGRKA
jgi:serine/threonine protein kinase